MNIKKGLLKTRRLERYRKRVVDIIKFNLEDSFWSFDKKKQLIELTKNIDGRSLDPYAVARQLM